MNRQKYIEAALQIADSTANPTLFRKRIKAYAEKHEITVQVQKGDGDAGSVVRKSYNPVGKAWVVEKAWLQDDGTLAIEGWVSTPDKDLERDVVEPEAFYGETFESYYQRSAPLSSNHNTEDWPIGHLQKGVLVRDGVIFQEEYHPTDPSEFSEGFDPAGKSGWYAKGVITDPAAARHVANKNVGAFSWIGNLKAYEPLPDGGKRYHAIDPLIESTIAAYPVNPNAVMHIAKAYGLEDTMPDKNPERDPFDLEKIMEEAAKRAEEAAQKELAAKGAVGSSDLGDALLQFETRIMSKLEEKLAQKAAPAAPNDEESDEQHVQKGLGRKSTVSTSADPRADNPVKYLVQKGRTAAKARIGTNYNNVPDIPFDDVDKRVIWELTKKGLIGTGRDAMSTQPVDGEDFADEYEL